MEENNVKKEISARKVFSRFGLALVIGYIASIIGSEVINVVIKLCLGNDFLKRNPFVSKILSLAPIMLICYPIVLLMVRKFEKSDLPQKALSIGKLVKMICCCFPIMFAGALIGNILSSLLSSGNAENPVAELVSALDPLVIFFTVIAAPVCEELVFRKLIIDKTAKYSQVTAIIFSALCFGLFHMNFFQFFYTFGLGLILGYVYVSTGKVIYTIIMHSVVNFFGSVLAPLAGSLTDPDKLEALGRMDSSSPEAMKLMEELLPGLIISFAWIILYFGIIIAGCIFLAKGIKKLEINKESSFESPGDAVESVLVNVGMLLFVCFSSLAFAAALFG